jgi:PucR C-terminal helix-turn-helix domain
VRRTDTWSAGGQPTGSFKATVERLILHKNSVQYRVRKAEEALGHPVGDNRLSVELALLASQWLGPHRPSPPETAPAITLWPAPSGLSRSPTV